jgi:hypothetical protein
MGSASKHVSFLPKTKNKLEAQQPPSPSASGNRVYVQQKRRYIYKLENRIEITYALCIMHYTKIMFSIF